ncbi:MAG: type VI secretion system protein TssA [Deltaproteobacteria bacterium]|nr:type VI secretion system protein TssA [Deltaproteobacteria bacterium]
MVVSARVEAWLQPISGPSPGGANARFDARHEAVRAQVAELDSPAGRPVDWKLVVQSGGEVLGQLSKDLLIAAYLAHGMYHLEGLGGLAEGTRLLAELLERYWESAFPEVARIKGRAAALTWFVERTGQTIASLSPGAEDRPALLALEDASKAFAQQVRTRFTDPAPPLGPLTDAVARLLLSVPTSATPAPDPSAPTSTAPPPGASPSPPAPPAPAPPAPPVTSGATPTTSPLAELEAQIGPLLEPIRSDAPAGDNAKFDPRHEAVRAQIARLDSPSGGTVDWPIVEREATALLQSTSKDLLIAAYLGQALFEGHGFLGLARAFLILNGLHEKFWAQAFPELARLKGRANALTWLFERAERQLAAVTPKPSDGPGIEALIEAYARLSKQVRERYEGQGPALGPLKDTLARLLMSVPKAAPPPPPAPVVVPASAPNPAPANAPTPPTPAAAVNLGAAAKPLADPAQVQDYLREVGNGLVAAAKVLRAADPSRAEAYRLMRLGLWLPLLQVPPSGPNGRTTVPPPPAPMMAKLEQLRANSKWAGLLEEAESLLPQARLCLDLQRAVAAALEGLGESHQAALLALKGEVRALLLRLPAIKDLKFADGTAGAGPETKAWLDQLTPSGGGSGAPSGSSPGEAEAVSRAAAHAQGGRLAEALTTLEQAARQADSGGAAFRLRLEAAKAAFAAGRSGAAAALFEALGQEAEARGLDQWDPPLAKAYLSAHLTCLRAQRGRDGGGVVPEKIDLLYSRLARLDPILALEQE